jgi:hypothetical protein
MCPVDGDAHLKGHIEDVALVAASGLTDDEHLAKAVFLIALDLGPDQTSNGHRSVVDCALLVDRQSGDHELIFGNFERNDVSERASRRIGRHGARPLSWIVCGREGLSTVRMNTELSGEGQRYLATARVCPRHDRSPPVISGGHRHHGLDLPVIR